MDIGGKSPKAAGASLFNSSQIDIPFHPSLELVDSYAPLLYPSSQKYHITGLWIPHVRARLSLLANQTAPAARLALICSPDPLTLRLIGSSKSYGLSQRMLPLKLPSCTV
jgi:hypothetical protein